MGTTKEEITAVEANEILQETEIKTEEKTEE